MHVGGLDSITQQHMLWARRDLRVGDEIVIRVVEDVKATRVRSRSKPPGKSNEQRERAWLRKTAQKHGYKLVKL